MTLSRQLSKQAVMAAILRCAPISRASLAKQTGLSKQTISEIVGQLEEDGFVTETGRTSGHIGRTAITYEVNPRAAFIIAVDLGGTKVRVALCDLACRTLAEEVAPTDKRGKLHVVEQIVGLARLTTKTAAVDTDRIRLAVVAVPGAPRPGSGHVVLAPNIPGFEEIDIGQAISARLGVEVVLENDVNLAAFGEHWLGAGRNVDDLVYIALGTGLGAGIMIGGELVRGATGAAGELGYLPFGSDPFSAEARRVGALERRVGMLGIERRFRDLAGHAESVPRIFDLAEAGDASARAVLDDTATVMARAVAAICAIVDPVRVLLGGGIGGREEIVSRVREILPGCMTRPPEVEAGQLGANATIVGATAIGLGLLHKSLFGAPVASTGISLPPADQVIAGVAE